MKKYRMTDAEFEIPDHWHDRTTHVFAAGIDASPALSLVVTYDKLREEADLADFAEEKLDELTAHLKQFRLIEKRQIEVAASIALEIEFRWRSEMGPVYQRQTYVRYNDQVIIFTTTAPRPLDETENVQVNTVLSSLKFRD